MHHRVRTSSFVPFRRPRHVVRVCLGWISVILFAPDPAYAQPKTVPAARYLADVDNPALRAAKVSLDVLPASVSTSDMIVEGDSAIVFVEIPIPRAARLRSEAFSARRPFQHGPLARSAPRQSARTMAAIPMPVRYNGITFDEDRSNSGFYHIPPDPHGAAGPLHLVEVVNTSISWYLKASGARQSTKRLGNSSTITGSFFEPLNPANGLFDPKVVYDPFEQRFVVIALERVDPATSRILVAVSATSDPNGTWYYQAINSEFTISSTAYWFDYPGLAVDEEGVYITGNLFTHTGGTYGGTRLFTLAKTSGTGGGLYAGGTSTTNVYDPFALTGQPGAATTLQPSRIHGTAVEASSVGVFLAATGYTCNSGALNCMYVIRVTNPLSSPTFTGTFVSLGAVFDPQTSVLPDAPQLGTATLIETNDRRALDAFWRSNLLYVSFHVLPSSSTDAGQVTAHWVKLNATNAAVSLADQGNIGGEDIATGTYTFFPSIAADAAGNMAVGFSASAPSIYPGAYATGRLTSAGAGTVGASLEARAGQDYYVRTFGSGQNRWGDYTATVVDPVDGSFWVYNEFALTRGTTLIGEDGRWGTVFGNFSTALLPVELVSFEAVQDGAGRALLHWETASETNNAGFAVETLNGLGEWREVGFVAGHGTTSEAQRYSYAITDLAPGRHTFRLRQVDLDGTAHYGGEVELDVALFTPYAVGAPFPNPASTRTRITLAVREAQSVVVEAFDALGRHVARVFEGQVGANASLTLSVDVADLPSGVYVLRVRGERFSAVQSFLVQR